MCKLVWQACLAGLMVLLLAACDAPSSDSDIQSVVVDESSSGISVAVDESESSSESSSEATSDMQQAEGPVYENMELGFRVELPALLTDHMSQTTSTREAYGETVTTVTITYEGEGGPANLLSFEEMSEAVWEQMQAEGGPLGTVLGTSDEGRVVVLNSTQSNPYAEGTEDYEVLNEFPMQLKVVIETFAFL